MIQKLSFFLPVRKGSQRVKNKNTRPFANIEGGLTELKLRQLLECTFCEEIVVSTDDPEVIRIADNLNGLSRIRIVQRPEELCRSDTLVQDLISYVPTVVNTEHIFWVHTTAPFVNDVDYSKAAKEYFEALNDEYDSLMSVTKHHFFTWDAQKKKISNVDTSKNPWPNTQDIDPIYEINHAFYISSVSNYHQTRNRIGVNPRLFELSGFKKIDIDWEDDFMMAETIFKAINK
ncbi:acylneuraminate cytidylyltransferase family protein [Anabaena sp. FACHB-1250]|jgi:CMP-N-acetylneuraminic acid synthetase|uniref:acylneuraminate cytidylyltransferase family protein n=1 Tax=Anabaena sp. FACHB-1250 TaxID=2692770 RepID=UPI0016816791|nr:acylneuraminate cytidylyltransferase family protein [Anabaena sp. FACHB-1250]MBD2140276.1 acylneuraminate cytidylyltransferase family protein [Anabaena sp. FACHB-1250]